MNVLLTGPSRGLGRYLLEALLADGHHVFGVERPGRPPCSDDERYARVELDLAQLEQLPALADAARRTFDRLDLVVHSAVRFERYPSYEFSVEDIEAHLRVNALAPYYLSHELAKRFSSGPTAHVLFGTLSCEHVHTSILPYVLSKQALAGCARSLAQLHCASGHAFATLVLGSLATERNQSDFASYVSSRLPAGRTLPDNPELLDALARRIVAHRYPNATQLGWVPLRAVYDTVLAIRQLGAAGNGLVWRLEHGVGGS